MNAKRWTLGVVLAAAVSLFGLIQADASPFATYVLTDDLGNRVNGTAPEQSEWDSESGGDTDNSGSGSDTVGSGSGETDSGGNGNGNDGSKDNSGHGNNVDGVDSSNKGNSKAGEDTLCEDGTYCDDEAGSGSKGKKK